MSGAHLGERLLVCGPTPRDTALTAEVLASAGLRSVACLDLAEVCRELGRGAAAAIVPEELLLSDRAGLAAACLKEQPPWSDFPLVVLTAAGAESPARLGALEALGGVILLKRPVSLGTLVSAARTALRDRRRQYLVRDQLAALAENETKFRQIADAVPAVLWITDPSGSCTFLSREWYLLTGQAEAEALGFGWADAVHPEDRAEAGLRFMEANETRGLFSVDYRLRLADGSYRWSCDSGRPRFGENGEYLGLVGTVIDLAERKTAEERLRRSETRFRQLADAMPQIVWTARPDGVLDEYNDRWYEFTGFARGATGDGSWEPILHPDDLQRCKDVWYHSVKSASPYQIEYRFLDRTTGGYKWFLGRALPAFDAEGRVERWYGSCTDIDATRRAGDRDRFLADAASALAEPGEPSAMLGRLTALSVPGFAGWCAADLIDEAGVVRRVASAFADPATEAIERELFGLYPPRPDDPAGPGYVLSSGEAELVRPADFARAPAAPQVKLLRRAGVCSWVAAPIPSRGRVVGSLWFARTSTGAGYSEDDLVAASDLARRAGVAIDNAALLGALREQDRRKDEFLATLAHELRNPLAPIRNGLAALRLGASADGGRTLIGMMERQLSHMVHLVDDLLDVSRVTSGKVALKLERFELCEAILAAAETSRPAIEAAGHLFDLCLPDVPLAVSADRHRMAQVFTNLLNNAAKYTPPGGRIWLELSEDRGEAVVGVRDTGVGIPPEMLPKVFDLFTQVGASLDRSQGGLGLGLTLVRTLVEMHGGRVAAESEGSNKGSRFVVRLPLAHGPIDAPAKPPSDADGPNLGARRILVVDDNVDAAESLSMLLRLSGHETLTAFDGLGAVASAGEFAPEVAFLDIGLPGLNGYEVARKIRADPRCSGAVLVALTGWGSEEDRRRARDAGFDHHLTKPVEVEKVEALLARLG